MNEKSMSQSIQNSVMNSEATGLTRKNLYLISGAAALSAGGLLLVAWIAFLLTSLEPITASGWLSSIQNNWLIVIFKLHTGLYEGRADPLFGWNFPDFAILALEGITFIGLYAALRGTSNLWSIVAVAQPFLGMVLFLATKTVGRSGVMGAVIVISLVMLRSVLFSKRHASIGTLAGILLLAGDIGVGMAPSNILAVLTGIGYMLLMTWFFLVARRLFQA